MHASLSYVDFLLLALASVLNADAKIEVDAIPFHNDQPMCGSAISQHDAIAFHVISPGFHNAVLDRIALHWEASSFVPENVPQKRLPVTHQV